jgi:uncharacterized delta-60 repeat protein
MGMSKQVCQNMGSAVEGRRQFWCWLVGIAMALVWVWPARVRAEDAVFALDTAFNPVITTTAGTVLRAVVVQPDGRIVLGGSFEIFHQRPMNGLARLDQDGVIDPTFQPWPGTRGAVMALALQPDGKLVVGGQFTEWGGTSRRALVRLNPNGALDTRFNPQLTGKGSYGVQAIQILADGRLLIGGDFKSVNSQPRSGVARLLADGQIDGSFCPGEGAEDRFAVVYALASEVDGGVLVGGLFTKFDGLNRNGLVRLLSDGTPDPSFAPRLEWSAGIAFVRTLALSSGGRILISGHFDQVNGAARDGLARLAANGELDPEFDPGPGVTGGSDSLVHWLKLLGDGAILIGGDYETVGGLPRSGLARLRPDGPLDTAFDPGTGARRQDGSPGAIENLAVQPDGRILAVGSFERVNGVACHNLARLWPDGRLDTDFAAAHGLVEKVGAVYALATQANGKYLVGGQFERVNGVPRRSLARLHPDGTLDMSFAADLEPGAIIHAIQVLSNQWLVIGGEFASVADTVQMNLARLDTSGALDASLAFGAGPDGPVYALAIRNDNRLLVGGAFSTFDVAARTGLAQVQPDGSLDLEFAPALAHKDNVQEIDALAVQADGRIVVGGLFDHVNSERRANLARLLPSGALDPEFDPGLIIAGSEPYVLALAIDYQNRIVAGGLFDQADGRARKSVARFLADGSLDLGFSPETGLGGGSARSVNAVLVSAEGQVLLGGDFATVDGLPHANLVELSANGSPSAAFETGLTIDSWIGALTFAAPGQLLVGGAFSRIGLAPRQALSRFQAVAVVPEEALTIRLIGGVPVLSWRGQGRLQRATRLGGAWQEAPGAIPPYRVPGEADAAFFRLVR